MCTFSQSGKATFETSCNFNVCEDCAVAQNGTSVSKSRQAFNAPTLCDIIAMLLPDTESASVTLGNIDRSLRP